LDKSYTRRTRRSEELFVRAGRVFAGGVNHNARFYEPYPIFVSRARGRHIWDEDGNRYTDYWMGHMALVLGHSPKVVTDALALQLREGTHYGMGSRSSVELGEEVHRSVPCAEMMRFCNTGAEATMYLVRLARAYTRKRLVIKMAGGWHGYNTELNKGVRRPFDRPEGAGILEEEQAHVRSIRFNDLEAAREAVKAAKGDVAAIFLEPVLGAGGCIPADRDYLKGLRELADVGGFVLAFDEIITGYRLALGGAQEWYGVTPDLATLGKIVGGGLPIGVVCGRKEIVSLADPTQKRRFVSIGGGTFSENPLSMTAGLATVRFLRRNASEVYEDLRRKGDDLRRGIDESLSEVGMVGHTTGVGSLFLTHFGAEPRDAEGSAKESGGVAHGYAMHMMEKGIFILPRHLGGISTVHSDEDLMKVRTETAAFGELWGRADRK
jgi:glutamate-1-semialdehyde 2,1-aminomutase